MKVLKKAMGDYRTNCYIVTIDNKDFIIDPGVGAVDWVVKSVTNPVAILNTHGHFDHIWSNSALQKEFNIPLYVPIDDTFLLKKDIFDKGTPLSIPDFEVNRDEKVVIEEVEFFFRHFPGHTPGTSVIEVEDIWFSGDFIFKESIGRWDFPFSSSKDMIKSLEKVSKIEKDFIIYTGHQDSTTLFEEKKNIPYWLNYIRVNS